MTPEKAPQYWDALPRAARASLDEYAYWLLGAIEFMRRRAGRPTFEATDKQIAAAASKSVWFVQRNLPKLKEGGWVTCGTDRGRRILTASYTLKGIDTAGENGPDALAHAPIGTGACAKTHRRKRQDVSAHAPMLPFIEERGRGEPFFREEGEPSRQSAAEPAAGPGRDEDGLASLSGEGDQPPPEQVAQAIAECREAIRGAIEAAGSVEALARKGYTRHRLAHTVASGQLAALEAGDYSALRTERPRAAPAASRRVVPNAPASPTRAAPPTGMSLDESIRLCRLGPKAADAFAAYHAAFLGEPDNPTTIETLRASAAWLRPDWVVDKLRAANKPGVRKPPNQLCKVLAQALKDKRRNLTATK